MKRWHDDFTVTYRQWKRHHRNHVESNVDSWQQEPGHDPWEVDCPCDTQIGRFRKKDAFDCGHTRCWICHSDKLPKRLLTKQEMAADLELNEEIEEMECPPLIRRPPAKQKIN
jgi:hypothetical protein